MIKRYAVQLPEWYNSDKTNSPEDVCALTIDQDERYISLDYYNPDGYLEGASVFIEFEEAAYIYYKFSWNPHLSNELEDLLRLRTKLEAKSHTLTTNKQTRLNYLLNRKLTSLGEVQKIIGDDEIKKLTTRA